MPTIPAWFIAADYAAQKVDQMNTTNYPGLPEGETAWTVELYNNYLDNWKDDNGNPVPGATLEEKAYNNFLACNAADYSDNPDVKPGDINVAPNQYFNIPVYLQNLAAYNNANPDAYAGAAPEGGWTAQNELTTIFDTYHSSVWNHYLTNWDQLLDVNPSNDFNTQAYLQLRADAMGNGAQVQDAIDAIKAANSNPIEDFYTWGKEHDITTAPIVETPTNPPADWNQWGENGGGGDDDTDPYDVNYEDVNILKGEYAYTGEAGQNTHFNAKWGTNVNDQTLNAKDVITGGEDALNSLVVELGKNWTGFNGITGDSVFDVAPNVTNVGRVVLNHQQGTSETSLTFDAKNISDDTVRYDLNNNGTGSISLKSLSDAVDTVNISGIKSVSTGTQTATKLDFVSTANTGSNDSLTLGIKDVCTDGKSSEGIQFSGIENVKVESSGEGTNHIDLGNASGIKALTVTGNTALTIANSTGSSIKTYDASEATESVNFGVTGLQRSAVVKGGAGSNDTITFNDQANVSRVDWTSIESLAFKQGGTVNAKGVEGIENIWILGDANTTTVSNLTADEITIYQNDAASAGTKLTTVNGTIGVVNYVTAGKADGSNIKAYVQSDNTGDVNINITGKDTLGDGSSFDFSKAQGTIDIQIANAYKDGDALTNGYTLNAGKATALTGNITGEFKLTTGNLASVQNVNIELMNASDAAAPTPNTFELTDMASAQNVQIEAGGEVVKLGDLGNKTDGGSVQVSIDDAYTVTTDDILAGLGSNITATITSVGDVTIGNVTTSTNALGNSEGDVQLNISTEDTGNLEIASITGDDVTCIFTDVQGTVGASGPAATAINAAGVINYAGAEGKDTIKISQVGAGTSSTIQLGEDADELTIDTLTLGAGKSATINVDLGSDTVQDKLSVAAATAGNLKVIVANWVDSSDQDITLTGTVLKNATDINVALKDFGGLQVAGTDVDTTTGTFVIGDNAYCVAGAAATGYTLVEVLGAAEDVDIAGGTGGVFA